MSALHIKPLLALIALTTLIASPAKAVSVASENISYTVGGPLASGVALDLSSASTGTSYSKRYRTLNTNIGTINLYDASVVKGTKDSGFYTYKKPDGLQANDKYISVYSSYANFPYGSAATFNLNGHYDTFSFTWGSMDSYNSLKVVDMKGDTYTLTGEYLLAHNAVLGASGKTTTTFSITDLDGIKKIVISSLCDAFEIANIRVSNVPLPAALPMFGFALAGLAVARKRKQKNQQAA